MHYALHRLNELHRSWLHAGSLHYDDTHDDDGAHAIHDLPVNNHAEGANLLDDELDAYFDNAQHDEEDDVDYDDDDDDDDDDDAYNDDQAAGDADNDEDAVEQQQQLLGSEHENENENENESGSDDGDLSFGSDEALGMDEISAESMFEFRSAPIALSRLYCAAIVSNLPNLECIDHGWISVVRTHRPLNTQFGNVSPYEVTHRVLQSQSERVRLEAFFAQHVPRKKGAVSLLPLLRVRECGLGYATSRRIPCSPTGSSGRCIRWSQEQLLLSECVFDRGGRPRGTLISRSNDTPRQFEYHPTQDNLLVYGTVGGEVVLARTDTGRIEGRAAPENASCVLALCWLHKERDKFVFGCDNGLVCLFDIKRLKGTACPSLSLPRTRTLDRVMMLTSVVRSSHRGHQSHRDAIHRLSQAHERAPQLRRQPAAHQRLPARARSLRPRHRTDAT
mgnify:CR=1 FL=1